MSVYRPTGDSHAKTLAATNAHDLTLAYDEWGDFDSWHEKMHGENVPAREFAKFASEVLPRDAISGQRALDVGAGTGAQAVYLREALGADFPLEMTALEPSGGMLQAARNKGCYNAYIQEGLPSEALSKEKGSYAAVLCCGSLLPSHMEGEAPFLSMLEAAAPEGYLVFNIRKSVYDDDLAGFRSAVEALTARGAWAEVQREERIYMPNESITAYYFCFRKA